MLEPELWEQESENAEEEDQRPLQTDENEMRYDEPGLWEDDIDHESEKLIGNTEVVSNGHMVGYAKFDMESLCDLASNASESKGAKGKRTANKQESTFTVVPTDSGYTTITCALTHWNPHIDKTLSDEHVQVRFMCELINKNCG